MRISDGSSDVCSSDRQLRADRRVRLESLHLVERGEVRVVVVEADDVADIGLVVLQVIDEGAAPGGAAHRPAGGVDDRSRLVLRGVELPELLDADSVGPRVGALTQGKARPELARKRAANASSAEGVEGENVPVLSGGYL